MEEIFFQTAKKQSFENSLERKSFQDRWLSPYLDQSASNLYIAIDSQNNITGYLTACFDTALFLKRGDPPKSLLLFEDLVEEYPCHFHINCSPSFQRQGVGRQLVGHLISEVQSCGIGGVFIVTSPEEENVNFYRKLEFKREINRTLEGAQILFMGRKVQ